MHSPSFGTLLKGERDSLISLGASILVAMCALAVCGYHYGVLDQGQYLVQVVQLEHPGALADDLYLTAFPALNSCFWQLIAVISDEGTRPAVCFGITAGIVVLNTLLLAGLLRSLLGPTIADRFDIRLLALLPALMLIVPKETNWFGLVALADLELTATLAVMPCVFGAMLAWTRRQPLLALAISIAALAIQGQTGAYLMSAWCMASLIDARHRGAIPVLAIAVMLVGALFIWRVAVRHALDAGQTRALFAIGQDLYSVLIDPRLAPGTAWAAVGAIVALGVVARLKLPASPGHHVATSNRTRMTDWWIASMAFPAAGMSLLALGVEHPLLWKLMVGRSFMLPQLGAVLFVGLWCAQSAQGHDRRCIAAALVVAVGMVLWPFPQWSSTGAAIGLMTLGFIMGLTNAPALPRLGVHRAWRVALPGIAIVAAMPHLVPSLSAFHAARQTDDWILAQCWASTHTQPGAVFVTPPYRSGWRLGSLRSTFGEVKDGGLLFYSGEAAFAWADRMALLGVAPPYRWIETHRAERAHLVKHQTAYQRALAGNLDEIALRSAADYVVMERHADLDVGEPIWANDTFIIRRLDHSSMRTVAQAKVGKKLGG